MSNSAFTKAQIATPVSIANGGTGGTTALSAFDNLKQQSSTTYIGAARFATAAEITAGTNIIAALTTAEFVASSRNIRYYQYRVLDKTTANSLLTTVGGAVEVRFTGTMIGVGAFVDTAGVTGAATLDIHLNGTTIMSATKITIDSAETSSLTAAAPVLTTTAVTLGDLLTFDIDAIQTTPALGLTFWVAERQS